MPGGLFDEASGDPQVAFQLGIESVNNQRQDSSQPVFEGVDHVVKYGDHFEASKKLCKILKVSLLNNHFINHLNQKYSNQ